MNELRFIRTDPADADFITLVQRLDEYLRVIDGDDHAFYRALNKVDTIKHTIVAYDADTPVGCGAIKAFASGTMEIKRMFVEPAYRGQGIAPALLENLEAWARELGGTNLILETGTKQSAAIRLYEKTGFSVIPNYGQYVGLDTSICFQKAIRRL